MDLVQFKRWYNSTRRLGRRKISGNQSAKCNPKGTQPHRKCKDGRRNRHVDQFRGYWRENESGSIPSDNAHTASFGSQSVGAVGGVRTVECAVEDDRGAYAASVDAAERVPDVQWMAIIHGCGGVAEAQSAEDGAAYASSRDVVGVCVVV